jgi:signal transduction histidine kinase/ActR/RegA family two-component response regulator
MPEARILVADDEPAVRDICLRSLTRAGYKVVSVTNGREAIERARQELFDLFLTDLKMPGMGGLEAYRIIQDFAPDMVMVVITGFGTLDAAIEALQLGASDFVLKPFHVDQLRATIARALYRQELERDNARLKALIPLFELSQIFMSSIDLNTLPKYVVQIAREEMKADSSSLMLLDDNGDLMIQAGEGLPEGICAGTRQKSDEGIAGYVVTHREPVILQGDLKDDPRFASMSGTQDITSAISLPLIHKDQILGVLNVTRTQEGPLFTRADVEFLSVLASQAAIAIENAILFQRIQEAYERLSELDHLKSEFISIASHELRAPLAVLLAYSSLLEQEANGSVREHLQPVIESAMQLKSIIDEMVSLRRIDTGERRLPPTNVVASSTIDALLKEFGPLARNKGLSLTSDISSDLPPIRADEQALYLILSNLLSNAIKFTPSGGAVHVSVHIEGPDMVVAVKDTGIGISEEGLERIFDRFYQVEDSLRREHGGIGLGLAIAREMADLLDGRLWVESQEGQGATFYLALPYDR